MTSYFIQPSASARLEEIYLNTLRNFGAGQADKYLDGAFALFGEIAARRVAWKPIPSELDVSGFYIRYQSHFVFWKLRPDDQIAIVAILHQRMDLSRRLHEDVREP